MMYYSEDDNIGARLLGKYEKPKPEDEIWQAVSLSQVASTSYIASAGADADPCPTAHYGPSSQGVVRLQTRGVHRRPVSSRRAQNRRHAHPDEIGNGMYGPPFSDRMVGVGHLSLFSSSAETVPPFQVVPGLPLR
jgi:hypothetical protein